jgi:hypothetical protein
MRVAALSTLQFSYPNPAVNRRDISFDKLRETPIRRGFQQILY